MTGRWAKRVLENGISRRDFLKATGTAAVMAAAGITGCVGADQTGPTLSPTIRPTVSPVKGDMVVAVDPDPITLVDRALDAFGGLSGIISPGDRVVMKANYSFAKSVKDATCNHPDVLVRIMQHCKDAGAKEVVVIDNTLDNPTLCLERSGIQAALDKAGFKAVSPKNKNTEYTEKDMNGSKIKKVHLANVLLEADTFINIPVIKSHNMSTMTASMKNLMGVIYDRGVFHYGLDVNIAELAGFIRPDLNIADAYRVMKTGGPRGTSSSIISYPNTLIVGKDPVAVDSYSASLLDLKGGDIGHIKAAYDMGLGEYDLSKVDIIRV
ncbi:hypothetical protein CUJ83_06760 [Methanocella sp. CWC-04]|uniref:DUF362 domain-containing protein n=1 Tax=Methanooceanicella nereidis TaxID=2052831 RepID=A0AAP2REQ3_9EURY|nr:DUF362 domain-containing protein [Methanocella sp. CWC-04]MCD1294700.1 hypothetical protein [Methanocella sp. CWC-04]